MAAVSAGAMEGGEGLLSVDYEVFGKVQGVFFRKYTQVRSGVRCRLAVRPSSGSAHGRGCEVLALSVTGAP